MTHIYFPDKVYIDQRNETYTRLLRTKNGRILAQPAKERPRDRRIKVSGSHDRFRGNISP